MIYGVKIVIPENKNLFFTPKPVCKEKCKFLWTHVYFQPWNDLVHRLQSLSREFQKLSNKRPTPFHVLANSETEENYWEEGGLSPMSGYHMLLQAKESAKTLSASRTEISSSASLFTEKPLQALRQSATHWITIQTFFKLLSKSSKLHPDSMKSKCGNSQLPLLPASKMYPHIAMCCVNATASAYGWVFGDSLCSWPIDVCLHLHCPEFSQRARTGSLYRYIFLF